jgi:hypothetical protein
MFATINVTNAQGHTLFTSSRTIAHAGDIGGCVHELTRDYPECVVNVMYAGTRTRAGETSLRDTLRVMGMRRGEHAHA